MSKGLDILIVGIAGENLESIASEETLTKLFENNDNSDKAIDKYYTDYHNLEEGNTAEPKIFYLSGETNSGSQIGSGLGYVIFTGNNNFQPKKLDETIYGKIQKLKEKFIKEIRPYKLRIKEEYVGVYALNVFDT